MKNFLLIIFSFLLVACTPEQVSQGTPQGVIKKDKMINVLTDIHIAEAYLEVQQTLDRSITDSLQQSYYLHIFESHGVSEAEYLKSMDYYTANPKKLEDIYVAVIENISTKMAQ